MYKTYYEEQVCDIDDINVLAYEIGNDLYTRKIISIYQSMDTDDDVAPAHLYLDIETVKKLIFCLQKAIDSFPKK